MLNGFMSRGGPNGWEAVLYDPDRRLGNLPANSELFEVLRQGADLLMSGKPAGVLCGSTREFKVSTNAQTGVRFLRIPLVGTNWVLTENQIVGHRSPVKLTMFLDFEFPQTEVIRSEETPEYEGD